MLNGFFHVPKAVNEPVKSYALNSPERAAVNAAYAAMWNSKIDVPLYIGNEEIRTGDTKTMSAPHDHKHIVGTYHQAQKSHIEDAIATALQAKTAWANMAWEQRAGIFLKAAELLAGPYRAKINAATMIAQSKTVYQAEIDASCELIDFLRFNVQYMTQIYNEQPKSTSDMWNRVEYRPLEGFVYAITPFNFTHGLSFERVLGRKFALAFDYSFVATKDYIKFSQKVVDELTQIEQTYYVNDAQMNIFGQYFTGSMVFYGKRSLAPFGKYFKLSVGHCEMFSKFTQESYKTEPTSITLPSTIYTFSTKDVTYGLSSTNIGFSFGIV